MIDETGRKGIMERTAAIVQRHIRNESSFPRDGRPKRDEYRSTILSIEWFNELSIVTYTISKIPYEESYSY
jgi:hypothetical protein